MNKIHIISALIFAFACPARASVAAETQPPRLKVVTTLSVLKNLAEEVGGELVDAQALSDPSEDAHFVQPRPTLMTRAREADLFIEIGLQLELWAGKVVEGSGNTKIQSGQAGRVIASAGISTLEQEAAEQGVDWEEVADQRAIEIAAYQARGVPPPKWAAMQVPDDSAYFKDDEEKAQAA